MNKIYLTRRNLLTLLSKLDRVAKGEKSYCTLIKRDDEHPKYPSTPTEIVAIEDSEYYYDRPPGPTTEDTSNYNAYMRAVDHARIVNCIGTAEPEDNLETATKKLAELIEYEIRMATDPAINGGLSLQPPLQMYGLCEKHVHIGHFPGAVATLQGPPVEVICPWCKQKEDR